MSVCVCVCVVTDRIGGVSVCVCVCKYIYRTVVVCHLLSVQCINKAHYANPPIAHTHTQNVVAAQSDKQQCQTIYIYMYV